MIIFVSLSVVLLGTFLLLLPFATHDGIHFSEAFFTSTSAFTVTGLAVVDTGTTFTIFGQLIILLLIKTGGIGIITVAILAFMMLGKKIGFKERILVGQSLNQESFGGILKLVKQIFLYSITFELVATLLLAFRWVPKFGFLRGLYYSFFHAVSAFNNAGFSLWPDSLSGYVRDPLINIVISSLYIIGGIGFTVLFDIRKKASFNKLSLHTKIMLIGTLVINLSSMLLFFFLESANMDTIGGMDHVGSQLLASYFQVTTTRTAGFNTLPIDLLLDSTKYVMILLMYIGAGSVSTSGGIKLTTFIIALFTTFSFARGRKNIVMGRRAIRDKIIIRAFSILTLSISIIMIALFILTITEGLPVGHLLFEVVSSLSTVGLSTGITADLTQAGRNVIMVLMFLGKIGPLTLAFSLAKSVNENMTYPVEDILTG